MVSVGRNAAWIAFEGEDALRLASLRKSVERTMLVPGDLVRATPLDADRVVIEIVSAADKDDKKEKKIARQMMQMMFAINSRGPPYT